MNVIICTSCKGEGEKKKYDDFRDWEMKKCTKCNGKGRLLTDTYSYEVPFNFPKHKLYKADEEIIKIIRNLNA